MSDARVRVACASCGAEQVLTSDDVVDGQALCSVCGQTRGMSILEIELDIP